MAYFRCTTGGSGKGNTLVVTCADELAGATITCTNGTKTYNKTCPSTSPYEVTFYGLEAGTWTVSATVGGNTYTATVVVVDCTALLGGFNWRTWVDTARFLDSTDYNSLDEVLADEEAVRELCLEHACVDYMAEIATASADVETIINTDLFAKWVNNSDYALDYLYANEIIADYMDTADKYFYGEWVITDSTTTPVTWGPKGNVPVMTSDTAPYGKTNAGQSMYSTEPAWKAFDGDPSTRASRNSNANDAELGYSFTNPVNVRRVYIGLLTYGTYQYKVQYSDDGSTWTYATDEYTTPTAANPYIDIDDYGYHLHWRIKRYSPTATGGIVQELQFYGRELWKQENSQYVPDYSEKEFEAGTTKKWLYDHGVELEELQTTATVIKGNDFLTLVAANNVAYAYQIDTTDYTLFRGKVGSNASGTNQIYCGSGTSNFTASNMPNNNALDVSNINGANNVGVKMTANGTCDITEFWLE